MIFLLVKGEQRKNVNCDFQLLINDNEEFNGYGI